VDTLELRIYIEQFRIAEILSDSRAVVHLCSEHLAMATSHATNIVIKSSILGSTVSVTDLSVTLASEISSSALKPDKKLQIVVRGVFPK
jgi:hypothetical protein